VNLALLEALSLFRLCDLLNMSRVTLAAGLAAGVSAAPMAAPSTNWTVIAGPFQAIAIAVDQVDAKTGYIGE
jgi:hypothetical protein